MAEPFICHPVKNILKFNILKRSANEHILLPKSLLPSILQKTCKNIQAEGSRKCKNLVKNTTAIFKKRGWHGPWKGKGKKGWKWVCEQYSLHHQGKLPWAFTNKNKVYLQLWEHWGIITAMLKYSKQIPQRSKSSIVCNVKHTCISRTPTAQSGSGKQLFL